MTAIGYAVGCRPILLSTLIRIISCALFDSSDPGESIVSILYHHWLCSTSVGPIMMACVFSMLCNFFGMPVVATGDVHPDCCMNLFVLNVRMVTYFSTGRPIFCFQLIRRGRSEISGQMTMAIIKLGRSEAQTLRAPWQLFRVSRMNHCDTFQHISWWKQQNGTGVVREGVFQVMACRRVCFFSEPSVTHCSPHF